jgi:hypothetical protein
MAERLVPLMPHRWHGFDSRSRPDLHLEWKRWCFSVTLRQRARSQTLQLRLYRIQGTAYLSLLMVSKDSVKGYMRKKTEKNTHLER